MGADCYFKAAPIFRIDRHEIQLQGKVVGNIGAMAEDVAPWAPFNADALMMLVPAGGRLVRSDPCAKVRRIENPFMAWRSPGSSLDDVTT